MIPLLFNGAGKQRLARCFYVVMSLGWNSMFIRLITFEHGTQGGIIIFDRWFLGLSPLPFQVGSSRYRKFTANSGRIPGTPYF